MTAPSAPPEPDHLVLAGEFPAATREQWRGLVETVLRRSGALPDGLTGPVESLLASQTYDGITRQPLYTAEDGAPNGGFPGLAPFVRDGRPDGGVLSGWDIRARHADPDPAVTRRAVLADLENGVTSLWLVLGAAGLPVSALAEVLDEVYVDLAPVTLDPGAEFLAAADALLEVHDAKGVPASEVKGNLGADPLGLLAATGAEPDLDAAARLAARISPAYPRLRSVMVDALPYHEAGGSDAEELGCAIAAGVGYLRALTAAGLDVDAAAAQLEFRLAAPGDQFLAIAKFRAARRLWARITEVCGAADAPAPPQHAVTSPAMMTRRDPWVNLLRATVACFGAGVGGAEAITVLPFDAALGLPSEFSRRIARNTQAILLEESKVAGVIDPAGGSWYVERLTDDLARAAWAWFTELERAGGLRAALDSGLVAERLAATWRARSANLATRADPITGVSEFPNLAEKPIERPPAAAAPAGGLPRVRYASAFEALCDLSDAELAEKGSRPKVFLATLGPLATHTARASFAANLFQAGGIETPTGTAATTPAEVVEGFRASGATVACICGADNAYTELAGPVASALNQAGARRVLLAGPPNDEYEVDGFVFAGCDALEVLRATLETLGVKQ